ncbi:MAG: DUF3291 domain-containing protein [bacterium]
MQPAGHHLAELNFGELRYDWDDPRVKDFVDGLDLVNGLAARSPGFIWRLSDDDMDTAQTSPAGAFGGNSRMASTLSVWRDVAALENFVWNTVHRQFYERRAEWYDAIGNSYLVMWWVPVGHRPDVAEGLVRFNQMRDKGPSEAAFGWAWLQDAKLWQQRSCKGHAAE